MIKDMKIYISGPISGVSTEEYTKAFFNAETKLRELGHEPINPLLIPKPDNSAEWNVCMGADIAELLLCDAIYLLPKWYESEGALLEKNIANYQSMKMFYYHDKVPCAK